MFDKLKQKKDEIRKCLSVTDKELQKMSWKEKQKYYALRSNIGHYSYMNNHVPYRKER